MTYDAWKCRDPSRERESEAQDALDLYQQDVWHMVVQIHANDYSQPGEEVPKTVMSKFEDFRDPLFDMMLDDFHPLDAAHAFLEEVYDK